MLLRIGVAGGVAIVFGLDKFCNVLVNWEQYLAPWVNRLIPATGTDFMYVAASSRSVKPRYGAYLVAAWLAGIIVNLLTYS